jgi:hypothetical protein
MLFFRIVPDALRCLFFDVRPFEYLMLVIEVLVLLLIAYEVGSGVWHRIRRTRRSRRVLTRLSDGQALQHAAPRRSADPATISLWTSNVRAWIDETNTLLCKYSLEASIAFLHNRGGADTSFGSALREVADGAQDPYVTLQERLNNLRSIIENPEVYL